MATLGKCYFYKDGPSKTRFFPQDLHNILPKIFNPNLEINKKYLKESKEEIIKLRDRFNFYDKEFSFWYNNKYF